MLINKESWDSLPEDLQVIVETAALASNMDMLAEYTARNNSALRELVDEHKVELRRLPDDVLAEIKDLSEQMIADMVEKDEDELSKRIYKSWSRYRDDVMAYHEISERAYINARSE